MNKVTTVGEALRSRGITRRGFLKYCSAIASLMALPPGSAPVIAAALEKARRPSDNEYVDLPEFAQGCRVAIALATLG